MLKLSVSKKIISSPDYSNPTMDKDFGFPHPFFDIIFFPKIRPFAIKNVNIGDLFPSGVKNVTLCDRRRSRSRWIRFILRCSIASIPIRLINQEIHPNIIHFQRPPYHIRNAWLFQPKAYSPWFQAK